MEGTGNSIFTGFPGAIVNNFLHPLDYIHEHQAKRRSRNNSISSECGDLLQSDNNKLPEEPNMRRCRTPEPSSNVPKKQAPRHRTPEPRSRNSEPWPVYKPQPRQRARPTNQPVLQINDYPIKNETFDSQKGSGIESNGYSSGSDLFIYSSEIDNGSKEWVPQLRTLGQEYKEISHSTDHQSLRRGRIQSPKSISTSKDGIDLPLSNSPHKDDLDSPTAKSQRRSSHEFSIFRSLRRGSVESPLAASPKDSKDTLRLSKGHSPLDYFNKIRSPYRPRPITENNSTGSPSKAPHSHERVKLTQSCPQNTDTSSDINNSMSNTGSSFTKTQSVSHTSKNMDNSDYSSWSSLGEDKFDGNCFSGKRKHYTGEGIEKSSSVEKLYHIYDQIIKEGQMRRHSSETDKRHHGSGTLQHSYMRGEMDPNQAAILFRDSQGLPAADPFLDSQSDFLNNISRSDLEQDESQIFVKFFKFHHIYDLIPLSAKLVVFDPKLQVKRAFFALVYNGVRAAPIWDSTRQEFIGMLTVTDFIRILQNFYQNPNRKMEELEDHRLETWRIELKDETRPLISIRPDESLYVAIRTLIHHKIHRLPVIDPETGNVLYIVTHKRILKFFYLYINELPKPSILQKPLRDMNIGTYSNIQTASQDTLIIEALNQFVDHRVSALPIVDTQGKLVDIYAKFDVINLAAEGTYNNLDVTLRKANEYRKKVFEEVHRCTLDETLGTIMDRIVHAEVHRLVVVDEEGKVKGVISLSDILKELVLKPCLDEEPNGLQSTSVTNMEVVLSATDSSNSSFKAPGEETTEPPVKNSVDPNENFPTEVNNEPIEGSPEPEVTINGVAIEIEDNVDGKWSSNDCPSQHCNSSSSSSGMVESNSSSGMVESSSSSGMVEQDAAKASPADSEEDEGRYSVTVIPITG